MVKNKKAAPKKQVSKKPSLIDKYKALFARDKFLWFLLTAGTVLLIGGAIFGSIVAYEKWQFNKAEEALDSLYADIVAELGQPIKTEKDKSCGYSSAKFNKGELSCRVFYTLNIPGESEKNINNIYSIAKSNDNITSIENVINETNDFKLKSFSFSAKNSNAECVVENSSRIPNAYYLSCSDFSSVEHYPVKD